MIYFVTWKVFKELLAMAVQCSLEQAPRLMIANVKVVGYYVEDRHMYMHMY